MEAIAWSLFRVNSVFYGVLCFLMLVRLTRHFPRLVEDFTNQSKSSGFLTLVPATCVLGAQFTALLQGSDLGTRYGLFLWIAGTFLWVVVMYTFIAVMTIQHKKSSLESAINGAWLLAVVATQSVSVLGTSVAQQLPGLSGIVHFLNLAMFLAGCMLYIMIITLIFYRLTFLGLTLQGLTPPTGSTWARSRSPPWPDRASS
jgi:tellurite resistance protein TehA-like permease